MIAVQPSKLTDKWNSEVRTDMLTILSHFPKGRFLVLSILLLWVPVLSCDNQTPVPRETACNCEQQVSGDPSPMQLDSRVPMVPSTSGTLDTTYTSQTDSGKQSITNNIVDGNLIQDDPVDSSILRGPTPPRDGTRFPFPQNRESPYCNYPSNYKNEDVKALFERWRTNNVTAEGAHGYLRVRRPNEPGLEPDSTVSEGIAYGMLIAVYMGEQVMFDQLWKYEQLWLDDNGLMDWYINAAGTERLGTGAATDADEDMAFALVMADRQWGGSGSLDRSYLEYAQDQIQRIWDHDIYEEKLPKAGDHWGDWSNVNISYFAPSYYRVFAKIDGNQQGWNAVIKTVYDTINNALNDTNGNTDNGLVPAWCSSDGVPGSPGHYQYDSCRTPFRIGLDWCMFGENRARDYIEKTSQFFANLGVDAIVDGYNLDGTPRPENPTGRSAAFIGPAAVGAMGLSTYQTFLDNSYADLVSDELLIGGTYYNESWAVLSLLMMSGNFLNYTNL